MWGCHVRTFFCSVQIITCSWVWWPAEWDSSCVSSVCLFWRQVIYLQANARWESSHKSCPGCEGSVMIFPARFLTQEECKSWRVPHVADLFCSPVCLLMHVGTQRPVLSHCDSHQYTRDANPPPTVKCGGYGDDDTPPSHPTPPHPTQHTGTSVQRCILNCALNYLDCFWLIRNKCLVGNNMIYDII